jgi:hypothetical protein
MYNLISGLPRAGITFAEGLKRIVYLVVESEKIGQKRLAK